MARKTREGGISFKRRYDMQIHTEFVYRQRRCHHYHGLCLFMINTKHIIHSRSFSQIFGLSTLDMMISSPKKLVNMNR